MLKLIFTGKEIIYTVIKENKYRKIEKEDGNDLPPKSRMFGVTYSCFGPNLNFKIFPWFQFCLF